MYLFLSPFAADKQHCAWPGFLSTAVIVLAPKIIYSLPNEKRMVLQCTRDLSFGRPLEQYWHLVDPQFRNVDVDLILTIFLYFQTLFQWGQKGKLPFSNQIHIIFLSTCKSLKTKVVLWLSLVVGHIKSHQLGTSSANLVASAQCLVTLTTSESQFRAMQSQHWKAVVQVAKGKIRMSIL